MAASSPKLRDGDLPKVGNIFCDECPSFRLGYRENHRVRLRAQVIALGNRCNVVATTS